MGSYGIPAGAPEYGVELEQRRDWDAPAIGEKHGLKLVGTNFFLSGDPVPIVISRVRDVRSRAYNMNMRLYKLHTNEV